MESVVEEGAVGEGCCRVRKWPVQPVSATAKWLVEQGEPRWDGETGEVGGKDVATLVLCTTLLLGSPRNQLVDGVVTEEVMELAVLMVLVGFAGRGGRM